MYLETYLLFTVGLLPTLSFASPTLKEGGYGNGTCRKTTVAIIGGGVAGITAAQALANQSITDFLILEYNGDIGGRMKHAEFGSDRNGKPYIVEVGAGWISGAGNNTSNGPENPVWTFSSHVNLTVTEQDFYSAINYDEKGENNFTDLLLYFDDILYPILDADAGIILKENYQDKTGRAGLLQNGWRTNGDPKKEAVEWIEWDWYSGTPPEETSYVWSIVNYNATYNGFSNDQHLSIDQRGFNTWLKAEASKFLAPNDSRLVLNTIVQNVSYSDTGVVITNKDGSCVEAQYAIVTVSLGVLQNDAITFQPTLPEWKQSGISTFGMSTYTKIFLQFNQTWWPEDKQFFYYADPTQRGYYTVFQSLSVEGFLPGSNILFVTLLGDQARRIEAQDDETTEAQAMAVLRAMFPEIYVPNPTAFMYPRWSSMPWAYGSYSNWPPGTTLEMHQNLRANVQRLYFAGEHTSAPYFGSLHGAWFEGREAGERIAGQLTPNCRNANGGCGDYTKYDVLHGTTDSADLDAANGFDIDPFFVASSVVSSVVP